MTNQSSSTAEFKDLFNLNNSLNTNSLSEFRIALHQYLPLLQKNTSRDFKIAAFDRLISCFFTKQLFLKKIIYSTLKKCHKFLKNHVDAILYKKEIILVLRSTDEKVKNLLLKIIILFSGTLYDDNELLYEIEKLSDNTLGLKCLGKFLSHSKEWIHEYLKTLDVKKRLKLIKYVEIYYSRYIFNMGLVQNDLRLAYFCAKKDLTCLIEFIIILINTIKQFSKDIPSDENKFIILSNLDFDNLNTDLNISKIVFDLNLVSKNILFKYLLKICIHFPVFKNKILKLLNFTSLNELIYNRTEDKRILHFKETIKLYEKFKIFNPQICRKPIKKVNLYDNLNFYDKWLLARYFIDRKYFKNAIIILNELKSINEMKSQYKIYFNFLYKFYKNEDISKIIPIIKFYGLDYFPLVGKILSRYDLRVTS
ncbi:hypothetical protein CWI36_0884p0020 [Hamiltosporidium magnivora]|uniref:Uncharacterized protein n=1 Tax=Hamiltosporidium magnivora TaxID=148818 RepID=A0A4Q9LA51_9MICR|nr:hypothetical protein CWI36_0884p0020 [Hamiltosporidium magnivora]